MTTEEIRRERVKQLLSLPSLSPRAEVTGGMPEDPRLVEAARLEAEAAPIQPRGVKENIIAGLQDFSSNVFNPKGMAQNAALRRQEEVQRQQSLLERAQAMRGESVAADTRINQRAHQNFQEDLATKSFESEDMLNRAQAIKAMTPTNTNEPYTLSENQIRFGPDNKPVAQGNPKKDTSTEKNQGYRDRFEGGRTYRDYFEQSDPSKVTSTADLGPPMPAKYSEPLVAVWDPGAGTNVYRPRGEAAGQIPQQPPTVLAEARNMGDRARRIGELRSAYKPEYVGPAAGRYYKTISKLPDTPFTPKLPEGYGTFIQKQADLKNYMVSLITGAAVGVQEEKRIMDAIPVEVDKPEIWEAKMAETEKNIDYLESLVNRQIGRAPAVAPSAPATPPKAGNIVKWGRDANGKPIRLK
jgi:hypothetical protein